MSLLWCICVFWYGASTHLQRASQETCEGFKAAWFIWTSGLLVLIQIQIYVYVSHSPSAIKANGKEKNIVVSSWYVIVLIWSEVVLDLKSLRAAGVVSIRCVMILQHDVKWLSRAITENCCHCGKKRWKIGNCGSAHVHHVIFFMKHMRELRHFMHSCIFCPKPADVYTHLLICHSLHRQY